VGTEEHLFHEKKTVLSWGTKNYPDTNPRFWEKRRLKKTSTTKTLH